MPMFTVEMKHSPEMCPMYNDKVRKTFKEQYSKIKEIAAKLDMKILINVSSAMDHVQLAVLEAPSIQAVEMFGMELGLPSYCTGTIRHVEYSEDVMKRFL